MLYLLKSLSDNKNMCLTDNSNWDNKGTSHHCHLCFCFWKRFLHFSIVLAERMLVFTLCLYLWSWLSSIHGLEFRYHNSVEMEQYLKDINRTYPEITHLHSIGQSVEGKTTVVQHFFDNIFLYLSSVS